MEDFLATNELNSGQKNNFKKPRKELKIFASQNFFFFSTSRHKSRKHLQNDTTKL